MACFTTNIADRNFPRRAGLFNRVWAIALACLLTLSATDLSHAAKHAAMAIDGNTGKVLYNNSGDELRHPASLTKMMTLYLVFELIEAGKLSYETRLRISSRAASQPPSKLGLQAGESIRVIDAIKALITKSANDVAYALAEHIGGSEAGFARMMTKKARAIGMSRTVFKNASGLPHDEQVTTARDMITLGLRLRDDFPQHFKLFSTRTFTFGGKTYRNHNKLLGQLHGVDGIKTGYIRASGFNLVTSIKRDGKYVVAAVFGGRTAQTRNAEMTSLIYKALKDASTQITRKPMLVAHSKAAVHPAAPARRPATAPSRETSRTEPQVAVARVRRSEVVPASAPASSGAAVNERTLQHDNPSQQIGRPPGTLQDQLALLLARSGVFDENSDEGSRDEPEPVAPTAPPRASGLFQVQVGAYATREQAEQNLAAILRRTPDLLSNYEPVTEPINIGSRTLYRARFAGFDEAAAASTCHKLRSRQIDCFVTR